MGLADLLQVCLQVECIGAELQKLTRLRRHVRCEMGPHQFGLGRSIIIVSWAHFSSYFSLSIGAGQFLILPADVYKLHFISHLFTIAQGAIPHPSIPLFAVSHFVLYILPVRPEP